MLLIAPVRGLLKLLCFKRTAWLVLGCFMMAAMLMALSAPVWVHMSLTAISAYIAIASMLVIAQDLKTLEGLLVEGSEIKHQQLVQTLSGGWSRLNLSLLTAETRTRRDRDDVHNRVSEISHSASELSSTAEQLAGNILQQSQSASSIAAAVTEISYSIEEISSRISSAYESANDTYHHGENGTTTIADVRDNMSEVSGLIEKTYQLLASLDERTSKVSSISTVIREIAEQTNLLALNAAIEAARAGEHGRGFAVVAEEVRALATRSHESAQEITANIEAVQGQMSAVKNSMGEVVDRADKTVSVAVSAETVFSEIAANTRSVSDMISAISSASSQQNLAVREISANIEEMAEVAHANSGMASQASDISNHLYDLCQLKSSKGKAL
jgi:methyl-accepting chemotaxis protein